MLTFGPAIAAARISSIAPLEALLLAQDLRVIDLPDLEAGPAGGGPEPGDAAVGADVFGRARQQQQERAPRLRVGAGIQRQRSDDVAVEKRGEFGTAGSTRAMPAPSSRSGRQDLKAVRTALGQLRRQCGETRQRRLIVGVGARIERNGARRGLAARANSTSVAAAASADSCDGRRLVGRGLGTDPRGFEHRAGSGARSP